MYVYRFLLNHTKPGQTPVPLNELYKHSKELAGIDNFIEVNGVLKENQAGFY